MIIENYPLFRSKANPGAPLAADGLPEFDPSKMRANGFDGGISINPNDAFPMEATCNWYGDDAVSGVDEYDWYMSQRTAIVSDKPFSLSRLDSLGQTRSGSIGIDLAAWASDEYADPFDLATARVLFFAVDLYVIRRSDNAIQRLDMLAYMVDTLTAKTNVG